MIPLLARFFRGLSYVVGITAPPPGSSDERVFVFLWLGIIVFSLGVFALLLYLISRMHLS
jgi:hypothetical protein